MTPGYGPLPVPGGEFVVLTGGHFGRAVPRCGGWEACEGKEEEMRGKERSGGKRREAVIK